MDSRIHVHVYSLIMPSLKRDLNVDAGASIADILKHIGLPEHASPYLTVALAGFRVHEDAWAHVRPKPGAHLSIGVMPAGDGAGLGKDQLRTASILAGIVGSYLIPGALGLSGVGAYIMQAALTYGGFWIATTLIPYQNKQPVASNQLTGARNQARQYGVIPKTYGRMRIYPPLAAAPQTEIRGNDHYLQLLLVVGYKPTYVDLSTMKIGETPLSEFDTVFTQVNDGWHNNTQITWFSGDIDEQLLDQRVAYSEQWRVDADGAPFVPTPTQDSFPAPGVVTLTTPSNTSRIDIDFTFPDGLGQYIGESRETLDPFLVQLQVQYRPVGSILESAWISHIPVQAEVAQVINNEAAYATRGICIGWIIELTAIIGDLINNAELVPNEDRNTPIDIIDTAYETATTLRDVLFRRSVGNAVLSITPISGEDDALDSLMFQLDRLIRLCNTARAVSDPEDLVYSKEFVGYFSGTINPLIAASLAYSIRRSMGNGDDADPNSAAMKDLLSVSQSIPEVFQTIATEYFYFAPNEVRAGIVRRNVSFQVPEGKWEVRIRKVTPDDDENQNILDEVHITAFRSHRTKPNISANMLDKLALIAIDILATDQLSGSLDQFSVEVETPLRYTEDGETWLGPALRDGDDNNVSRNPAWIMADILTQPPNYNPVDESRIDGPNLLEFATWCTENNFHFDHTFDQRTTVWKAMEDACKVAKASPTMRDGKYAVVHDKPQSIPRAMITITNANNFEFGKTMQNRAQALRIKFKNPAKDWSDDELYVYDDRYGEEGKLIEHTEVVRATSETSLPLVALYQDIRRVYDIGSSTELDIDNYAMGSNTAGTRTTIVPRDSDYNFTEGNNYLIRGHVVTTTPTRVEEISIPGLVDVPQDPTHAYHSNQVYKLGRYLLAVAKLRPEIFKATLDIEQLVFERGDRVEVQMDTVLWGLGSSRIRSLTRVPSGGDAGKVATVTLEQDLFLNDATSYAVRFRNSRNGLSGEATFEYDESEPNTITLDAPLNDSAVPLVKGDLVAWGEPSKTTISCLVQEIRNQRDHSAEVTMIQYSPGVFVAEDGPIPEFDPGITIPPNPERGKPPRPSIVRVTTDESVLERDTDGSYQSRIVIDLNLPQGRTPSERDAAARVDAIHVQFRRAITTPSLYRPEWVRSGVYARDVTRVSIRDVEDGNYYDVRIRAVTKEGVGSDWAEMQNVLVVGKTAPPPDVSNLRWDGWTLKWDYIAPFDHAGFRVRMHSGGSGTWDFAQPAHDSLLSSPEFTVAPNFGMNRSYHVKAVDTSGNESVRSVFINRTEGFTENVIDVTGTVPDSFASDTIAGDQAARPFYKAPGFISFYHGPSDPFYHRVYEEDVRGPGSRTYTQSDHVVLYPGCKWHIDESHAFSDQWWYEGKSPDQPFWPADLAENLWPESLSMNLWPSHLDWEIMHDGLPWHDGVSMEARIVVPPLHTESNVAFYLKLMSPKLIEEKDSLISETTGPGDNVTLTKRFNEIVEVQVTITDMTTAAYADVGVTDWDRSIEGDYFGPRILLYDNVGARTTGSVRIKVIGY